MRVNAVSYMNYSSKTSNNNHKSQNKVYGTEEKVKADANKEISFKGLKGFYSVFGLAFGACFGPVGAAIGYTIGHKIGKEMDNVIDEGPSNIDEMVPDHRSDIEDWYNGR